MIGAAGEVGSVFKQESDLPRRADSLVKSGGALSEQLRQDQAAQLTAAQPSATDQHAQRSTFFAALLLFRLVILGFVSPHSNCARARRRSGVPSHQEEFSRMPGTSRT